MPDVVMAYVVTACVVMAYVVMAFVVMAYVVIAYKELDCSARQEWRKASDGILVMARQEWRKASDGILVMARQEWRKASDGGGRFLAARRGAALLVVAGQDFGLAIDERGAGSTTGAFEYRYGGVFF